MGNSAATGHMMNACGCTDALGFQQSAKTIINVNGIEPWNARSLVKDNLIRQGELAKRSPLRQIHVNDGLRFIGSKIGGFFTMKLTRDKFVQAAIDLLMAKQIRHAPRDREELFQIFDSMDFDRSGYLSLGEWAGGLSVFFNGTQEECLHAVFEVLDRDKSNSLTKSELQEYLKPFVKAMSPPEADSLRPILLKKATDDIYEQMDLDHKNDISAQELLQWTKKGNNVIDKLADIIDREVYQIWLQEKEKQRYTNLHGAGPSNLYGNGNQQGSHQMYVNHGTNQRYAEQPQAYQHDRQYEYGADAYAHGNSTPGRQFPNEYGADQRQYDQRGYGQPQQNYGEHRQYGDYGADPYAQQRGGSPMRERANDWQGQPQHGGGYRGGYDDFQSPCSGHGGYGGTMQQSMQHMSAGYGGGCEYGHHPPSQQQQYGRGGGYDQYQGTGGFNQDHYGNPPPPPPPPPPPRR